MIITPHIYVLFCITQNTFICIYNTKYFHIYILFSKVFLSLKIDYGTHKFKLVSTNKTRKNITDTALILLLSLHLRFVSKLS